MKELRVCNSIDSSNKKKSHIHSLPEEIIIYILVRLPADVLYDSVRFVCRNWFNIVNTRMFIREHLLHCGRGFLFQSNIADDIARLAEFGESDANVTDTRLPSKCHVFATCDGLAAVGVGEKFYVANLLTKQTVSLPPVNPPLRKPSRYSISLVRGSEMDDYRVVFSHLARDSRDFQCMFITVGKDHAWKPISCGDLGHLYKVRPLAAVMTIGVGGMVYWLLDAVSPIFALGNDMETMHQLPNPISNYKSCRIGFTGGRETLSIVISLRKELILDIWFLSHSGNCFEWRKEKRIDLSAKSAELSRPSNPNPLQGVALLKNGEVVVLKDNIGRFVYHNVETWKTFKFGSKLIGCGGYFSEFAYSLVRLSCS